VQPPDDRRERRDQRRRAARPVASRERPAGAAASRGAGAERTGCPQGARRGPADVGGGTQRRREAQGFQVQGVQGQRVKVQGEDIGMGQKTHPIGFRLGATRTWSSRWFATKGYADLLHEDVKIRRYIKDQLYHAGISKIDIERSANRARITIATARPGIIIGRKGSEVEKLKNELQARTGKEVYLNIEEVIHPELDAQLVAENRSEEHTSELQSRFDLVCRLL